MKRSNFTRVYAHLNLTGVRYRSVRDIGLDIELSLDLRPDGEGKALTPEFFGSFDPFGFARAMGRVRKHPLGEPVEVLASIVAGEVLEAVPEIRRVNVKVNSPSALPDGSTLRYAEVIVMKKERSRGGRDPQGRYDDEGICALGIHLN
ncbi:MAG: hypothetical protein ACUVXI_15800 [bacterium]